MLPIKKEDTPASAVICSAIAPPEQLSAKLKVSFFGPFYSGYNVIAIDDDYRYALVVGESLKYLWLLSRETTMPENVKQEFLTIARKAGYNTDELLWVEHDRK